MSGSDPPLLVAEALVVQYAADRRILDGVDLEVRAGQFLAIVGPSGSGKSTLLAHLAGLRRPEGGRVRWQGRPLAAMRGGELDAWRGEHVGFVFQRAALLPFLTVRENVAVALECAPRARRVELARGIDPLLERMGVLALSKRRADRLSVGEAQRIAVARALVKEPRIVLADEPTGSLDAANTAAVLELLLADAEDRTVIVATHDERVSSRCGRRLLLSEGKLS